MLIYPTSCGLSASNDEHGIRLTLPSGEGLYAFTVEAMDEQANKAGFVRVGWHPSGAGGTKYTYEPTTDCRGRTFRTQ